MSLQVGNIVQVTCHGMSHSGEGVCRYEDLVVFVPFVLPDEVAEIEIIELKSRYGRGQLLTVLETSLERQEPPCKYYGTCGGCQLQHLEYQAQLNWKKQMVKDAFKRIGNFGKIQIEDVQAMERPWNYRNKMQLPVGKNNNTISIGCYEKGTHQVVDTTDCLIQSQWNNDLLLQVKRFISEENIPIYSESDRSGWLRHVTGRSNRKGEGLLILVVTDDRIPGGKEKLISHFEKVKGLKGIILNVNPKMTNAVLGRENIVIYGENSIKETLGNYIFSLSGTSFFQVNPSQTEKLYNKILEISQAKNKILDAYCGTGTIALYLSENVKGVVGIERDAHAIEDARNNALANSIVNCEFWSGNVEEYLEKIKTIIFETVIVDPPRSGCSSEMLKTLIEMNAKQIIYVSCNPSTLARDVALLDKQGWSIGTIYPFDMFPQTSHVECVVSLEKMLSGSK